MNGVGDASADGKASAVGVSVGSDVSVGSGVSVAVGVRVEVAVGVLVEVGVGEGVKVGVGDSVAVGVNVGVRVAVGATVGLDVEVGAGDVDVGAGGDVRVGSTVGATVEVARSAVTAAIACVGAAGGMSVGPGPASRPGRTTQPTTARRAARAGMAARSAHPGMRRSDRPQKAQVFPVLLFTMPQCRQRTWRAGCWALPQRGQMRCPSCMVMPQWGQVVVRWLASTLIPSSGSGSACTGVAVARSRGLARTTEAQAGTRRGDALVETRLGGPILPQSAAFAKLCGERITDILDFRKNQGGSS